MDKSAKETGGVVKGYKKIQNSIVSHKPKDKNISKRANRTEKMSNVCSTLITDNLVATNSSEW